MFDMYVKQRFWEGLRSHHAACFLQSRAFAMQAHVSCVSDAPSARRDSLSWRSRDTSGVSTGVEYAAPEVEEEEVED